MDINFNKNEDFNKLLVSDLRRRFAKVKLGGGKDRIEKHHEKGKMTARERVNTLLDDDAKCIEIGAFAGDDMYQRTRWMSFWRCGCEDGLYQEESNVLLLPMMLL